MLKYSLYESLAAALSRQSPVLRALQLEEWNSHLNSERRGDHDGLEWGQGRRLGQWEERRAVRRDEYLSNQASCENLVGWGCGGVGGEKTSLGEQE